MEQEKLEQKVRELFEQQGFNVSKDGSRLKAENGKTIDITAFASENYSEDEVVSQADDELVFVDEELAEVQDRIENDVSIIKEEESAEDYELPSYEIVGDIAVINELVGVDEEEAVEGILEHHSHVKTVLLKEKGLEGEFRVGNYRKLYGDVTKTVHKEFGCRFKVDPTKVYFSERFSTERNRVVSQVEKGEEILVMFAGVGPFAIMAAKNQNPRKVVAVEKNPEGASYLKENIDLNNVEGIVEGLEGDVNDIVPDLGRFDRIVMPLPESAHNFLGLAFEHAKNDAVIHYYRFLEEENWDGLIQEIEELAEDTGLGYEIEEKAVCGQRGPAVERVCIDIRVKRD